MREKPEEGQGETYMDGKHVIEKRGDGIDWSEEDYKKWERLEDVDRWSPKVVKHRDEERKRL